MPKITIITSIYQVADYIERFIDSLKSQTFKDFVVFFMNDGTKDNSFDIIRDKISGDIAYQYIHVNAKEEIYRSDTPQNLDDAVNHGLNATRKTALTQLDSEYFIFIDPDDWVDANYLEKLVQAADKNHSDLTKAEICKEYDGGKVVNCPRNPSIRNDISRDWPISRKCCGSQWITILYRTDFVHQNQITFKERRDGFEHDADDIFLLECLLHQPTISFVDDTWYHYYQRATSAVHTIDFKRYNSTVKARDIEVDLLNCALDNHTLSPKHYGIIIRRILWELAKHYRIYNKYDNFDRAYYFSECTKILEKVKWGNEISHSLIGFIDALLEHRYRKAHFLMSNGGCVVLDKIRLLPYGI
ncbi:MAG: glycosyltransferase family 2 protein [Proteobacteria bacterium]|nr:glycosyltransferase family 2 protein [Pseudomonadota bacterium]